MEPAIRHHAAAPRTTDRLDSYDHELEPHREDLTIHTVGRCRISMGASTGTPASPLARAVLLTLAAQPRRSISLDTITSTVWDTPPAANGVRVSTYIGQLRTHFGPYAHLLRTHRGAGGSGCAYQLDIHDHQLDVYQLRDTVLRARQCAKFGDTVTAMRILESGLRGHPLDDDTLPHTPGMRAIRQRVELIHADAVWWYATWCLRARNFSGIERFVLPYLVRCPMNKKLATLWNETVNVYFAHNKPGPAVLACQSHPRRHQPDSAPAWINDCETTRTHWQSSHPAATRKGRP